MRYIDLSLIDPKDPEVKAWIIKAKRRQKTLESKPTHDTRADYLAKANFWTEFKPILQRYFGNNCWYSECALDGSFGDVDHFRPKNRSTDEKGNTILPDGYWWLTYDYLNYRLSCEKCNRKFGEGGKNDCFPLEPETIPAVKPFANDSNTLLDPCCADDVNLIDSDETGEIKALSSNPVDIRRVEISKKVYNLSLFNARRKEIRSRCKVALDLFETLYTATPENLSVAMIMIHDLVKTETAYSSFAKRYILQKIDDKPFKDIILKLIDDT